MGQICFWDSKSFEDTMILIFILACILAIGIFSLLRLFRMKRYGQHGNSILVIYVFIFIWFVFIAFLQIYSIVIYFAFLKDKALSISVDTYSRQLSRFSFVPAFMIQTIFLQICRLYNKGLINSIEVSKMKPWQIHFITFTKYFSIIRIFTQIIPMIYLNMITYGQQLPFMIRICLYNLIFDSVIINLILIVSLNIYIKGFNQLSNLNKDDLFSLKKEFTFMMSTCIFRVIVDFVFWLLPQSEDETCMSNFQDHRLKSIFYLLMGNIINHLLPILMVLKIYNIRQSELQMNESQSKLLSSLIVSK